MVMDLMEAHMEVLVTFATILCLVGIAATCIYLLLLLKNRPH